jgi:hypothetical protein
MNELVNLVVQKTGLSQENAQKAVQTVIDFLKSKLPAPIAGQVDAALRGDFSGTTGQAGEMFKGKLGGMMGGGTKTE